MGEGTTGEKKGWEEQSSSVLKSHSEAAGAGPGQVPQPVTGLSPHLPGTEGGT